MSLFYAHDDGGAVVVAAAAPGLGDKPRRELLRPFAAVLAQQLERKARTVKYTSQYELKTKLIRYGLSLGYDYEAVMDAASAMVRETDTCNDF